MCGDVNKYYDYGSAYHYLRNVSPQKDTQGLSSSNPELDQLCDFLDFSVKQQNSRVDSLKINSGNGVYDLLGTVRCIAEENGADECPVIRFVDYPGLFYIPRYLTQENQLCLANECLRVYLNPPNLSNIYTGEGMEKEKNKVDSCFVGNEGKELKWKSPRVGYYWRGDDPTCPHNDLLNRLRWVSLGHHYEWSERSYDTSKKILKLPEVFRMLTERLIGQVTQLCEKKDVGGPLNGPRTAVVCAEPCNDAFPGRKHCEYVPNAALVNIYKWKDSLNGHRDDAEGTMEQSLNPLVSMSLGAPGLFLVGTSFNSSVKPLCLVLYSGDCLILSKSSRLLLHGVPRILARPSCDTRTIARLCRKERRKRLKEAQQVSNDLWTSSSWTSPRECRLDCILQSIDEEEEEEKGVSEGIPVGPCRLKERLGKPRLWLIETLQLYRLNISIRQRTLPTT